MSSEEIAGEEARDLIFCWTTDAEAQKEGTAVVACEDGSQPTFASSPPWALVCFTKNAEGQAVTMAGPVVLRGVQGERILLKLGPGVWKPTIGFSMPFKAHVTIVDVPDPAPWEKPR